MMAAAKREARFGMTGRACVLLALVALTACASKTPAPIVDRSSGAGAKPAQAAPLPAPAATAVAVPTPVAVNRVPADPRSPTYVVQRGDTLFKIALEMGQAWRDIAAWNNLDDPNRIEVGQTLRVLPPEGGAVAQASPVRMGTVEPRAATSPAAPSAPAPAAVPATNGSGVGSTPAAAAAPASPAPAATAGARPAAPEPAPAAGGEDEVAFAWPAKGAVVEAFNDVKNKGVDIAGKAGDPVFAAADGQVVYAGSGLRGYGNLIIVKHNATYLTAYAHNQALVVKEGQRVKKGQKIAEMGSSDADRVKLHFEIRRQGRPVDPAKLLPDKP